MAEIVFGDGGRYYRPGNPHVFPPGQRAAAHYLNAVDQLDPKVKTSLFDEVLGNHPFPTAFRHWQGLTLSPDSIELKPIPGQSLDHQKRNFQAALPFLEALQAWASEYYLWSPHILGLLYRILELRRDILSELRHREASVRDWESDPEPMTDAEVRMIDATKARVEFLTGELDGWGWWVDFLASDASIPDLTFWSAGQTARTPEHRRLFERMNGLHVAISWEPPSSAPAFRLALEGWRPEEETWSEAENRLRAGFDDELKVYRDRLQGSLKAGSLSPPPKDSARTKSGKPHRWKSVPTKNGDHHFRWLALRQVKGLRPSQIKRSCGVAVSTVNEGIGSVAKMLQLPLRPVRTGPPAVLRD